MNEKIFFLFHSLIKMPIVVSEAGIKFLNLLYIFTVMYTAYYILLDKVWDGKIKQPLKIRLSKMYSNVQYWLI